MWLTAAALAYALLVAPPCGDADRPPDPRCGDALDGRALPPADGVSAGRALLTVPHLASEAVLWPVLKTSEIAERRKLPQWLHAITTSDDGLVGVRPQFQYATGFLPVLGLRLFYDRLPGKSASFASFRTAGPDVILTDAGLRGPPAWGLAFDVSWNRRRDRLFAGIGPARRGDVAASTDVVSRYSADIGRIEAGWSSPQGHALRTELGVAAESRSYGTDPVRGGPSIADLYGASPDSCAARGLAAPCVDPVAVPGFETRQVAQQRGRVALDLRAAGRDASGFELALTGVHTHGLFGDRAHHGRLELETVLALGGQDRALILRGLAAVVEPLGSGFVPFDDLVTPSGANGMRGFPMGRFRDRSGVVGTAEWRWLVASSIDASLFTDAATAE